ncbi:putative male sterility domain-containing protein [Aspergillus affinis]|uniref:putative male sterility domain-containing protein n=1 Tax=Aspergillus affinis TaxID=1070780 RepID=UPI0022FE709C|nr:putative male sterility domain-containing protein [Aspergillus affinis]KAI9038874.1 putative male sterility domain-containing protein [Aspergillus affinis]
MWDYFDDKCVLITGGSGFLGTAIVYRLVTHTAATSPIYVLCRGGRKALYSRWRKLLPSQFADRLCQSNRLIVVDGDIKKPNVGLSDAQIDIVRQDVEIVIHAASSINLKTDLTTLTPTIIQATETVAKFALTCHVLTRFVYVSSAYANAHLGPRSEGIDVLVDERIYNPCQHDTALTEWKDVQKIGTSWVYEAEDYPWAYAYAKHLTERLLLQWFGDANAAQSLLIIRPSIIGPAQKVPYPGYCFPNSTPLTTATAAVLLSTDLEMKTTTRFPNPDAEVHMDEVPVDVVADRLLSHLAIGTAGCVHAVSGERARMKYLEWWRSIMQLRQIPWEPKRIWLYENWKTPNQHPISQLWVAFGSSFCFSEDRTRAISEALVRNADCADLQLFTTSNIARQLLERTEHLRTIMDQLASKNPKDAKTIQTYYRGFGSDRRASVGMTARL